MSLEIRFLLEEFKKVGIKAIIRDYKSYELPKKWEKYFNNNKIDFLLKPQIRFIYYTDVKNVEILIYNNNKPNLNLGVFCSKTMKKLGNPKFSLKNIQD